MIKFKYRYCKVHMAQYLSGDLSDTTRRRIARYIDECEDCYREYIRQRNLANELERELPSLGRPSGHKLDNMWASIQAELAHPSDSQSSMLMVRPQKYHTWGYGLVMLIVVVMLLTPLVVGYHASASPVQLPPRPQTLEIIKTPTTVAQDNRVVLASITQPSVSIRFPVLQNTPVPVFRQ
jgi:anti-sigma factor RsiW